MHTIIAMLVAVATPAPRPTLPPVIFHVIPSGSNPRKACGVYRYDRSAPFGKGIVVKCQRPKGLKNAF